MRTTSSFKLVGALALPKNLFPIVGPGKMPAFSKDEAFGSRNGRVLALNDANFGLLAAVAFALTVQDPEASGVLSGWPAVAKSCCCAGEIWFAQGACKPEFGIGLPFMSLAFAGRKPVKLPP